MAASTDDGRTALYAAEMAGFDGTGDEDVISVGAARQLAVRFVDQPWWPGPSVRLRVANSSSCVASIQRLSSGQAAEIRLAAPRRRWRRAETEKGPRVVSPFSRGGRPSRRTDRRARTASSRTRNAEKQTQRSATSAGIMRSPHG